MDYKILKKIFKYIFNKPLYIKYYKPLKRPTYEEQELIENLKKAFKDLPHENVKEYSHPERIWKQNMNHLRELVLTGNPREFLRWDIILETMFVGNENYMISELDYLRKKQDWDKRWEKAIQEVETGFPIPFNKYPQSSGNLIHHAYHVAKLEEKTGVSPDKIDLVCEFGGGYGCMCRLFFNLGFKGKYIIYDFPHLSALQKYYLKTVGITVHPPDNFQYEQNGVTCVSDIDMLKDILSAYSNYSNTLFIAMWSISETPLHIKDSILQLISRFDTILISYQDNYGGMDNIEYFNTFKRNYDHEIRWNQWDIKHLPGNTYLVGTRSPTKIPVRKGYKSHRMTIDKALHNSPLYRRLKNFLYEREYRKWELSGKPVPTPHMVKQITVKSYADKYSIGVMVETGTYLGEMVNAVKYDFQLIYSIELSDELCENAMKKFSRHKHISIVNGDSAEILPEILMHIDQPCLFWLDGHYSAGITAKGEKETPIMEELKHIFNHSIKNHIILIDDARLFTGEHDYPTLASLEKFILNCNPKASFDVQDDVIRIHSNKLTDSSGL
jgi:hypothetical protein